jgi:hypothetical protein
LIFFHFGSYHKARSIIIKDFLSAEQINFFKEYWKQKRREEDITFIKIYKENKARQKQLSFDDAIKRAIQFPEFLNCKTKKELHLFAIRAFSDYNVSDFARLEVKLWEQLAKQRRIEIKVAALGKKYNRSEEEGQIIDALEYSASGLYGALGEELFRIYARRKRWEYWKASDFLLTLKNGRPIEKLSYYYSISMRFTIVNDSSNNVDYVTNKW